MSKFWDWVTGKKPVEPSDQFVAPEMNLDGQSEKLTPEQANRFIDYMQDRSGLPAPLWHIASTPLKDTLDPTGQPKRPLLKHTNSSVSLSPDQKNNTTPAYAALRAVDTHTELTYAYCQAGHLHAYANGKLVTRRKTKAGSESKHFKYGFVEDYASDASGSFGWTDKTVVRTELCGD